MPGSSPRPLDFEGFTLDLSYGCLRRGLDEIKLRPKSFQVLRYLVENRGRLLSKEELMQAVWGDEVVTDNSLVQCLIEVRRALRDGNQTLIRTIPRRGYIFEPPVTTRDNVVSFAGPIQAPGTLSRPGPENGAGVGPTVKAVEENAEDTAGSAVTEGPIGLKAIDPNLDLVHAKSRRSGKRLAAIVIAASVLAVAFSVWLLRPLVPTNRIDTVAVLPFQTMEGGERNLYLELGMADALITRLSAVKQLTVRPTSSVRPFIGTADPVSAGKQLRVGAVVDGCVQKLGDRIRVSARLVRVADGKSLWADTYDERFSDIFSVQDAFSSKIASALSTTLSGEEAGRLSKRYATNTEAYELYLRGKFFFERRNAGDVPKAAGFFEQVIQKDPNYAPAYAALANCYGPMLQGHLLRPNEGLPKMEEAVRRALELDPTLAEAHIALAAARFNEWDFPGAERESRRAIELNPSDALAHNWYGYYLGAVGRQQDYLNEARRALELDPLSRMSNGNLATAFFAAGQYLEALKQTNRALALDPNFTTPHSLRAAIHARMGQRTEAVEEFRKIGDLLSLSEVQARFGDRTQARFTFTEFVQSYPPEQPLPQLEIACLFTLLGDTEEAFRRLELAYREHDAKLLFVKSVPELAPLRTDSRFTSLLARVRL